MLKIKTMKITNKTFIVTGAGSGMGRELTIQLVQKGARVAMVDINDQGMNETAELAGRSNVSSHHVNITDRESVEKFAASVMEQYEAIDGLINNAGIIQPFVDVKDLDYQAIERVFNINFYGTLYMTKSFLPHFLNRPEAHIANVSSMGGFIPFPGQTIYSASKAAVKIFTEGLYAELKETNVGVTVLHPGAVSTNIMSNSGLETASTDGSSHKDSPSNALSAKKAAAIMIAAIEKDKFRATVGMDATMLDLFYRVNPRAAIHTIVKNMGRRES